MARIMKKNNKSVNCKNTKKKQNIIFIKKSTNTNNFFGGEGHNKITSIIFGWSILLVEEIAIPGKNT